MNTIPFVKMHGLGNDFVIINSNSCPASTSKKDLAIAMSDRNIGIGCDQFIIYSDPDTYNMVNMDIFNQDGSKALACGNASRCLSKLISETKNITEIILKIDDRKVVCKYLGPNEIIVNMGDVSFEEKWIPETNKLWGFAKKYRIEPKELICADVGNPHLVIFSKLSEKDMAIIGNSLQNSELFPDGVNVNFARIEKNNIHLKVWERGAGFTYACGSGAIASFTAANKLGFTEDKATVIFEYGALKMHKNIDNITMQGSATHVFSGEYTA